MLRLIVLVAFVANLNYVLTDIYSAITSVDADSKLEVCPETIPVEDGIQSAKLCKKYEEYEECPNRVCREKTCDDLGYHLKCFQTDIQNITCGRPQCICQAGYVKNKHGICIPSRECQSCGGDANAVSGCGTYCTRCSNYKSKHAACILFCRLNSCDCRSGHVFDDIKKKCVLPEQCPCGRNEVRSDCANSQCILEECSQQDLKIECKPDRATCKPGCLCAEGYLRNEDGVCIPRDKCPPPCGTNEEYRTCANAGCGKWNCSQLAGPDLCIDVFSPDDCVGGCVCANGYLSNSAGQCVEIDKCPSNEVCPNPNEYLDKCSTNCPDDQCGIGVVPTLVACTRPSNPADCIPQCRCKKGFQRDSNGRCVAPEDCPPQCGPNEVNSDCGNNGCRPDCLQPDKNLYCKFDPRNCKTGCVCAEGYLRDRNRVCVLKEKCQYNSTQCGLNEVPSDCANNGCLSTCAQPDLIARCTPDLSYCQPGCVCAEGYLLDDNGVCVLSDQCPPKSDPDVCHLPPVTGLCRGSIPKFYYDYPNKDCFQFNYGGCGGNGNKFDTKEECLQKCACNNK